MTVICNQKKRPLQNLKPTKNKQSLMEQTKIPWPNVNDKMANSWNKNMLSEMC